MRTLPITRLRNEGNLWYQTYLDHCSVREKRPINLCTKVNEQHDGLHPLKCSEATNTSGNKVHLFHTSLCRAEKFSFQTRLFPSSASDPTKPPNPLHSHGAPGLGDISIIHSTLSAYNTPKTPTGLLGDKSEERAVTMATVAKICPSAFFVISNTIHHPSEHISSHTDVDHTSPEQRELITSCESRFHSSKFTGWRIFWKEILMFF